MIKCSIQIHLKVLIIKHLIFLIIKKFVWLRINAIKMQVEALYWFDEEDEHKLHGHNFSLQLPLKKQSFYQDQKQRKLCNA